MLSLLSLRLATPRVPLAVAFSRPAARPPLKLVTRSFLTTALRAEPTKSASEPKHKSSSSAQKPKRKTAAKSTKAAPKKTAFKPKQIVIPSDVKIPHAGPSPFTYFLARYYNPERPKITSETLINRAQEGAAAWHALSPQEKERITAEATVQRDAAREKRKAYVGSLDPKILKEINRRRVARGKPRIHAHVDKGMKKPGNQYIQFANEYRVTHAEEFRGEPVKEVAKKAGKAWRALSDAEKEPYRQQFREATEVWKAETGLKEA